ncbi:DUF4160 domain-containing protein [Agrobacterium sp. NPDC089420]|uniref:DUF4160 domain-containing protein n=1 Tax=Agrobacterium sp. NPDC089420 TaxID=3363918 RepID=UPI00384A5B10
MPVVFRSGNLTFFFYSNEGDPREPVHIHVRKAGAEAKIWLEPATGSRPVAGSTAENFLLLSGRSSTIAILS